MVFGFGAVKTAEAAAAGEAPPVDAADGGAPADAPPDGAPPDGGAPADAPPDGAPPADAAAPASPPRDPQEHSVEYARALMLAIQLRGSRTAVRDAEGKVNDTTRLEELKAYYQAVSASQKRTRIAIYHGDLMAQHLEKLLADDGLEACKLLCILDDADRADRADSHTALHSHGAPPGLNAYSQPTPGGHVGRQSSRGIRHGDGKCTCLECSGLNFAGTNNRRKHLRQRQKRVDTTWRPAAFAKYGHATDLRAPASGLKLGGIPNPSDTVIPVNPATRPYDVMEKAGV